MAKKERKPREPSPYNVFIREEIPRLKQSDPELNHKAGLLHKLHAIYL